jgi:branched-chain amino acid transport system ATP-binding protein
MVCIARSRWLAARPAVDEPSLGLAPKMVARIFDLIASIRAAGRCPAGRAKRPGALRTADYAYVLDQGRIALEGPASELAGDERVVAAYLGG